MPKAKLPRKDFVWTSNLAYAIGLITTDGCLSPDGRHITFTSSDIELIETFKKCLRKKNKISINPPSKISKKIAYRVQFGDVVFYDWLKRLGLTANKSLTIAKLDIENRYFVDFTRGHLDGDGSIIYFKDRYNTKINPKYVYDRIFVYFKSASKNHLVWLRRKIKQLIKTKGSLQKSVSKTQLGKSTIYTLKYSTKEAKIILNWIYYKNNLPCLRRKFIIARPFLRIG